MYVKCMSVVMWSRDITLRVYVLVTIPSGLLTGYLNPHPNFSKKAHVYCKKLNVQLK